MRSKRVEYYLKKFAGRPCVLPSTQSWRWNEPELKAYTDIMVIRDKFNFLVTVIKYADSDVCDTPKVEAAGSDHVN